MGHVFSLKKIETFRIFSHKSFFTLSLDPFCHGTWFELLLIIEVLDITLSLFSMLPTPLWS